jgi:hypothetical protein
MVITCLVPMNVLLSAEVCHAIKTLLELRGVEWVTVRDAENTFSKGTKGKTKEGRALAKELEMARDRIGADFRIEKDALLKPVLSG